MGILYNIVKNKSLNIKSINSTICKCGAVLYDDEEICHNCLRPNPLYIKDNE